MSPLSIGNKQPEISEMDCHHMFVEVQGAWMYVEYWAADLMVHMVQLENKYQINNFWITRRNPTIKLVQLVQLKNKYKINTWELHN